MNSGPGFIQCVTIVPTPGVPSNPVAVNDLGSLCGYEINTGGTEGRKVNALAVVPMIDGGNGQVIPFQGLPDGDLADDALPTDDFTRQGSVARLTGLDQASGNWWRLRSAETGIDNLPNVPAALIAASVGYLYRNNDIFGRARSGDPANLETFSTEGVALSMGPGEWAINHAPAAATRATITRAAAGAGNRNVCRSITVCHAVDATAATVPVYAVLRDGATGAGTILWQGMLKGGANSAGVITLSGLNIVGSANTAMTLEFTAAPEAGHFQTVSLTGNTAFS